jgi:hypothetical protein
LSMKVLYFIKSVILSNNTGVTLQQIEQFVNILQPLSKKSAFIVQLAKALFRNYGIILFVKSLGHNDKTYYIDDINADFFMIFSIPIPTSAKPVKIQTGIGHTKEINQQLVVQQLHNKRLLKQQLELQQSVQSPVQPVLNLFQQPVQPVLNLFQQPVQPVLNLFQQSPFDLFQQPVQSPFDLFQQPVQSPFDLFQQPPPPPPPTTTTTTREVSIKEFLDSI